MQGYVVQKSVSRQGLMEPFVEPLTSIHKKEGNKLLAHGESSTSFRQKTLTHGEIIDGSTMRPSLH
jgi:hypothetical protein